MVGESIPAIMHNYSFGITSMAAVLKESGHAVSYFPVLCSHFHDGSGEVKYQLRRKIEDFKPAVAGVSFISDFFKIGKEVINYLKETFPDIFIIAGGPHATSDPEGTIRVKGLSGICLGESEYALLELLDRMQSRRSYTDVCNFWFKRKRKIIRNPQRSLIDNLDSLPLEDLEILEENRVVDLDRRYTNKILPQLGAVGQADIMASRGCPGACNYCFNYRLRQLYNQSGSFCRRHSSGYITGQIKFIKKKYKISKIHFWDDSFADNIKWLRVFLKKYREEIHLPFRCLVRPNLTEEKVRLLKESGCHTVNIGVECGSDYIRNKILNRPGTKEQILRSCRLLKKYKIFIYTFSIVGCPYENESTLKETFELIRSIEPHSSVSCSIFKPYPGTKSYLLCKQKGWLSRRKFSGFFADSRLNLPGLSRQTISKYQRKIVMLSPDFFSLA